MHQDWKPIILGNPSHSKNKSTLSTVIKKPKNSVPKNVIKADRDEIPTIKTITLENSNNIKKCRSEKGWTQKELANKINEKVTVVSDYESGKAVYDAKIMSKIRRVLNF
jgi:putative transcription factor